MVPEFAVAWHTAAGSVFYLYIPIAYWLCTHRHQGLFLAFVAGRTGNLGVSTVLGTVLSKVASAIALFQGEGLLV